MSVPLSILIVEDDSNSAFVLKTILEKAGYFILPIAASGEEALHLTQEHHPALVLMDISLSGNLDGIDTVLAIRQHYDIPIVYLTGHTSESVIKRAKATTPYGFILKPYTAKMVLVTTEMAFHKASVERESKETKIRLAVTLGNLLNPVFSVDANGVINYVNTAGQTFVNKPLGDILNQSIDSILHLHTTQDTNEAFISFLDFLPEAKPNVSDRHALFVCTNNSVRHVYVQVSCLRNLYGELLGYVVALNDFTEQFKSEAKNRMLAKALENSQEGVIVVESEKDKKDFKILYANQSFFCMLKIQEDSANAKPLSSFWGQRFNANIIRALQENQRFVADTPMVCCDGEEKIMNWALSPFSDTLQGLQQTIITIRDVTKLRQIQENLRQTQKIEAVGRLASGIAHDFNNLLAIINGCVDLALLEEKNISKKTLDYLKSVQDAGTRGAILVQQLMMFARKSDGPTLATTHGFELTKTLNLLTNYLGKDIDFASDLPADLWPLKIPVVQLDQILVNLCVNARDAMPNGGKLKIAFENFCGCPPDLLEGRYVKITVSDTGVGMDKDTLKKIFEPFFTTKPIGKGTGLGLSSVYGLVKRYDGSLQVESQLGKGTVFMVFLPIDETTDISTEEKVYVENKSIKVCYVNLEDSLRTLLYPFLVRAGWHVLEKKPSEKGECVVISHDPHADVYVPRHFEQNATVQHPYAVSQLLQALSKRS